MSKKYLLKTLKDRILKVFDEVIKDYNADAILLSGGLDISILAYLLSRYFKPHSVTVGFTGSEASDVYYVKLVAEVIWRSKYPENLEVEVLG